MREEELRAVLLVRAIEETDRDGALIPPADRAAASREAKRAAGGRPPKKRSWLPAPASCCRGSSRATRSWIPSWTLPVGLRGRGGG
jgi:hypothetical protein